MICTKKHILISFFKERNKCFSFSLNNLRDCVIIRPGVWRQRPHRVPAKRNSQQCFQQHSQQHSRRPSQPPGVWCSLLLGLEIDYLHPSISSQPRVTKQQPAPTKPTGGRLGERKIGCCPGCAPRSTASAGAEAPQPSKEASPCNDDTSL